MLPMPRRRAFPLPLRCCVIKEIYVFLVGGDPSDADERGIKSKVEGAQEV